MCYLNQNSVHLVPSILYFEISSHRSSFRLKITNNTKGTPISILATKLHFVLQRINREANTCISSEAVIVDGT